MLDLKGKAFVRWSVDSIAANGDKRHVYWNCVCSCGSKRKVCAENLTSGQSTSCGCYRREILRAARSATDTCLEHCKRPEYKAWRSMKDRCLNPQHQNYEHYGARGITVCQRWIDRFENFFEDIGLRPSRIHSLDRIDNNGNYEPSNCQWATSKEQARNRRTCRVLTALGRTLIIAEWARLTGISHSGICRRLARGLSATDAVSLPLRGH